MSNQHSLIALDWLMPVLQDVFDKLTGLLQQRDEVDLSEVAALLHQIAGVLTLAQQKHLAMLAKVLEQACQAILSEELSSQYQPEVGQSVALLYYELRQFQQIQRLHIPWIVERINFFNDSLGKERVVLTQAELLDTTTTVLTALPLPRHPLTPEQKHDLQTMWRYATLQLLTANNNQPAALTKIAEVAKFLTNSDLPEGYRRVWYLVNLWAGSQQLNDTPTPHDYHYLLDSLDKLIIDSDEPTLMTARVAVDVLVHLSQLLTKSEEASALLTPLHLQDSDKTETLFKKTLSKLETAIYQLDRPEQISPVLAEVKTLLANRGWSLYDSHLDQIIADVQMMIDDPSLKDGLHWQVERQLQDLYSQLLETADTLETKIGATQFATTQVPITQDSPILPPQVVLRQTRINLENIKHAFNTYVQSHDSKNLVSDNGHDLDDDFVSMVQVFGMLGLEQPKSLAEQLRLIFTKITHQPIDILSWQATDALAQSIAEFELFLDYLSHHNLNDELLEKIQVLIREADTLVTQIANHPLQQAETINPPKIFEPNTPIYDDEGEKLATDEPTLKPALETPLVEANTSAQIKDDDFESFVLDFSKKPTSGETTSNTAMSSEPIVDSSLTKKTLQTDNFIDMAAFDFDGDNFDPTPIANEVESEALQNARALLKPDTDEVDEEIREIFIEEAEEVLESLDSKLPTWKANPYDLVTLNDIRRGFHTLKGSGRMVGALQLGETAWSVENMLNRVLDGTLEATPEIADFLIDTRTKIPTLLQDFAHQRTPSIDPALIILQANNLLKNHPLLEGMPTANVDVPPLFIADTTETTVSDAPIMSATVPVVETATADDVTAHPVQAYSIYEEANENSPTSLVLPQAVQAELDTMTWADDVESDPDIQEIYIEEAQEVLDTIVPQFEVWQKNPSNLVALKDIRRGFHTLKGSGRMVGAHQLGELGWSIESMLNRVLDGTIEPTTGLVTLVGDVIKGFAPLIDTFAQKRTDYPHHIKVWAATANAYSKKQGDGIDYPQFLQAPSEAVAQPTTVPQAQTAAVTENTTANDTVTEMLSPVIETAMPTIDDFDRAEQASDADSEEEELRFEDDPEEDAEDDNYVGQIDTRLTIDKHKTVGAHADEIMFKDEEDTVGLLSEQPDMLSDEDVIGHVFLEESTELLNKITQFIHNHHNDKQTFVSDDLVRAFHTLRGGAALSELPRVYALSAALENSLEELLRNEVPLTQVQLALLEGAKDDLVGYISDYKTAQATHEQPEDADNIAQLTRQLLEENGEKSSTAMTVTQLMDLGLDDLVDGETHLRQAFGSIETLNAYLQTMHEQASMLSNAVNPTKFVGLADTLVRSYADLRDYPEFCQDEEVIEAFESLHAQLTQVLDNIAAGMNITWNEPVLAYIEKLLASKKYHAELLAIEYETPHTDIELLDIFLQEASELDKRIQQMMTRWQSNLTNNTHIAETRSLRHALHTLKGGARMVGLDSIGDLSHVAETVYQAITEQKFASSAEIAAIMQHVQDTISTQLNLLKTENRSFFANKLVKQLTQIVATNRIPQGLLLAVPVIVNDKRVEIFDTDSLFAQPAEDTQQPALHDEAYSQEIINNFEQRRLDTWQGQEPDEDLLSVYLEEAKELIDSSSDHLQEFRNNTSDIVALQALQRELHTIKGGARMVGAEGLANLSHEMETIYEELGSRRKPATRMVGNLLATCHDWLASALYVLENKYNPQTPQPLIDALLQFSKNPDSLKSIPQASLAQQVEQIKIYQTSLLQVQEDKTRDLSMMPPMSGNFEAEQEQSGLNAEMIRISSSLMERMINLAGESAINRARIDMGVSGLTNTIEEMGVTVQRLADQLRRMETELEVQILAQIADERTLDTDFDPLEMDQYSSLNQLSKSLSESASDLLDIKTTMLDKTRDTENLLLQLSRTQTELQEGLMNSRMVPFSRVTPRLQRIVRQTANELNKSVELRVLNDDSEVDRNILDHITSPLEHMIRNAVDHGIERTQERIESGKSRTGLITLELVREGGEIVIYLTDDGKGINVDAVRKKAIEQGLIAADDTTLSAVDIMQYIFNAGLSTSASVTQISGRGVGMDVVQSEVKQLGGVVSVDSEVGKGSRFILRLPLTVAVTDALVVRAGDKQFAVPLVQIERVVRISAETIYAFHDSDNTTLDIDGHEYRLRYLNQILYATNPLESVRHQTASVPVIIIRNETGQHMALQVDAIAGSRVEVVVKPLGRQLSHIAGISSATIMGDGSVMLILDLIALMRNAINAVRTDKTKSVATVSKPVVLIIDDSVTVRKVTSRLLERNGFEAQIAKDGVDALEVLQSLTPDIMLLDIEMPRMDGFEVANQVRHTERLKDVPIIMITSRTGEKHRERAMSIGVNAYMGKPFQEQDLLENITRLLNEKAVN